MRTFEARDHNVVKMGAKRFLDAVDRGLVIDSRFVPPQADSRVNPFGYFVVKVKATGTILSSESVKMDKLASALF
jgi:hypothetical protein